MKNDFSRRNFLQTSAISAAAILLPAVGQSAEKEKKTKNSITLNQNPLKIGLMTYTLGKDWDVRAIPCAKTPKKLPEVLHQDEVLRLFAGITNIKHRAIAMTIYAAGLRVSEVAHLQIADIDSKRMLIHVR